MAVTPDDLMQSPYASWLEELVESIVDLKPTCIGAAFIMEDGTVMTAYYDAGWMDKVQMNGAIQADITMDIVRGNAEEIVAAAEDALDEDDENEDEAGVDE